MDDSSGNASPSDSVSSIPSCMPFSWFGDRERSRDREREKEQSLSSCSLPHSPTEGHTGDGTERRNKVRTLHGYKCTKTPATSHSAGEFWILQKESILLSITAAVTVEQFSLQI